MSNDKVNRGICATCGKVVPVRHEDRDGKVYLVKECPRCGESDSLVSSNAERYRAKRDLVGYAGEAQNTCALNCATCNKHKPPTLVFIDVTNRCNMNCPICLANIPAMGFRFDPPMDYFEKIFQRLAEMKPKPKIQLFGGEPTVREDLIDMILLAKQKYGLQARVVTNGLRLANEEYCKKLLKTGTQLMFSFDGRDASIYERGRKHPKAYERKMKALENIRKHRKSKITIMTAVGEGMNDQFLADLVDFCHEGRDYIAALDLIPLTAHWGPEEVEAQSATIEDVERMMGESVPGMQFFPAGYFYGLSALRQTFDLGRITFGGSHPNCESVSLLVSDGSRYRPISDYVKGSFMETLKEVQDLDKLMQERLPKSLWGRLFGRRGRQLVYGSRLLGLMRRRAKLDQVFTGSPTAAVLRVLWGLLTGKKLKNLLRANSKCHSILRAIVLPFEESGCVESARLVDCPAAFAYEHAQSGDVRLMPVCAWAMHKNHILRDISTRYGTETTAGDLGLTGLKRREEVEAEIASEDAV
jgi:uncharacterized radical SAM superfamily Fe-S cluster-containing enzyme